MNLNKKIYISLSAFALIGIFLIFFLIVPFFKKIKKNSEELLLERKKTVLLAQEQESLKGLEGFYGVHESDLKRIESLFIKAETPVDFIDFLEQIAKQFDAKIDISAITKRTKEGDFWPSLSVQLSIKGSIDNFFKFLEKLENGPFLIEVTDLNIKRITEKELRLKEFTGFTVGDTGISLLIKIYTK